MKSEDWKSYRTRFLVNAKQLNSSLSFVDHLGRQHRGRKGDYLVESSDGVISIAPRRIFEDIYVPMPQPQTSDNVEALREPEANLQRFEALEIEEITLGNLSTSCQPMNDSQDAQIVGLDPVARSAHRKLPQPCRDRRSSGSRLGLM